MEPTAKTVANKMVLPMRMAQMLVQGKSRAPDVAKPDQSVSVLRIGLASADGTGRIRLAESVAVKIHLDRKEVNSASLVTKVKP